MRGQRHIVALMLGSVLAAPLAAAQPPPLTTLLPGRMPLLGQGETTDARTRFLPAPVPNVDMIARNNDGTTTVRVRPGLTPTLPRQGFGGNGYAPGSVYSGALERRGRAGTGIGSSIAPSVHISVPLEYERR